MNGVGTVINGVAKEAVKEREDYLRNLVAKELLDSRLCEVLIEKGITTCPASATFHGNFDGGLFYHCKAMYEALEGMTEKLGLHWLNPKSPANIAWGHDVCKLGTYIKSIDDWNEDGSNKLWHYEKCDSSLVKGHGSKSVIVLQQAGVSLTEEEMVCILYHMGAYETDSWDAFDRAIKKYPNVLFTHTADMCASKIMGV